jgi:hypothetical protein
MTKGDKSTDTVTTVLNNMFAVMPFSILASWALVNGERLLVLVGSPRLGGMLVEIPGVYTPERLSLERVKRGDVKGAMTAKGTVWIDGVPQARGVTPPGPSSDPYPMAVVQGWQDVTWKDCKELVEMIDQAFKRHVAWNEEN